MNRSKNRVEQGARNARSGKVWEVWECYKPESEEEKAKPWAVHYYAPSYMIKDWTARYATKAQAQIRLELEERKEQKRVSRLPM